MRKPLRDINDNRILTQHQKVFLSEFTRSEICHLFRLTGGTALSAFYLEHRLSEDLDFLSDEKVPLPVIDRFLKTLDMIDGILFTRLFDRNIFTLKIKDGSTLKVEFTHYPLVNIEEPPAIDGLRLDGFLDIIVNKLCAIADRFDAKDYVDVYWALKTSDLSLHELIGLAERKCDIKGIRHILKSRLLQIPDGIKELPLKVALTKEEIKEHFDKLIRDIVSREL